MLDKELRKKIPKKLLELVKRIDSIPSYKLANSQMTREQLVRQREARGFRGPNKKQTDVELVMKDKAQQQQTKENEPTLDQCIEWLRER